MMDQPMNLPDPPPTIRFGPCEALVEVGVDGNEHGHFQAPQGTAPVLRVSDWQCREDVSTLLHEALHFALMTTGAAERDDDDEHESRVRELEFVIMELLTSNPRLAQILAFPTICRALLVQD